MLKIFDALSYTKNLLKNIEDEKYAEWEALLILSHILKIKPLEVYFYLNDPLPKEKEKKLKNILQERLKRRPLAYILKEIYFWGRKFYVEKGVLIPRQETEVLIEAFLELDIKGGQILELGVGSGNIVITLLLENPELKAIGVDISERALKVCKKNAEFYKVLSRLFLIKGDWFSPLKENFEEGFEAVLSNPPYISEKEWKSLEPEVREFEPEEALIAREKGLYYHRLLLENAHIFLKKEGFLIFEIGYNQKEAVENFLKKYHWNYRFKKDLRNFYRVVIAWKEDM